METKTLQPRKKKQVKSGEQKPSAPAPSLGFRFTPADERAMERAKKKARKFMLRFGSGIRPADLPLFDRWHYLVSKDRPRSQEPSDSREDQ